MNYLPSLKYKRILIGMHIKIPPINIILKRHAILRNYLYGLLLFLVLMDPQRLDFVAEDKPNLSTVSTLLSFFHKRILTGTLKYLKKNYQLIIQKNSTYF